MTESTKEVLDIVSKVLLWCWILGFALQFVTFAGVAVVGEFIYDIYESWFGLSHHDANMIIVSYGALLKLLVSVFLFIPWLAILVVLKRTKKQAA